jgi:prolipoprotein diacylglyceryl transferase
MLHYIIWNADPVAFNLLGRDIRWYGIFFAVSFYLGYLLLEWILQKKKMTSDQIGKLTFFLVIGCILGLRLGHCFFYEPGYYLKNPLEILQVWKGGLASHGAAVGILIALYLYVRKVKKPYFWLLDRIVIVILLIAPFIRTGNLMNSEIIGDKTNKAHAFMFVREIDKKLTNRFGKYIGEINISRTNQDTIAHNTTYHKLNLEIFFKKGTINEKGIQMIMYRYFIPEIEKDEDLYYNIKVFDSTPRITITENPDNIKAVMAIYGIPRHPAQLYEASAYLIFFILFFIYYRKQNGMIREGFLFGMFLICVFGFRFFVEFYKEVQVPFEHAIPLKMGQWLSIPLVMVGIAMVWRSKKKEAA